MDQVNLNMNYGEMIESCRKIIEEKYSSYKGQEREYTAVWEKFNNNNGELIKKVKKRLKLYKDELDTVLKINGGNYSVNDRLNDLFDEGINTKEDYYGLSITDKNKPKNKAKKEEIIIALKKKLTDEMLKMLKETELTEDEKKLIEDYRKERKDAKTNKENCNITVPVEDVLNEYKSIYYDISSTIMGQGSLMKNPYIKIKADGVPNDSQGFYITVSYNLKEAAERTWKITEIHINLTCGSKDNELSASGPESIDVDEGKPKRELLKNAIKKEADEKINLDISEWTGSTEDDLYTVSYTTDKPAGFTTDSIKQMTETLKKVFVLYQAGLDYAIEKKWKLGDNCKDFRNKVFNYDNRFENATEDINRIGKLLKANPQIVLYGPPGTGKTRTAKIIAGFLTGCLTNKEDIDKNLERLNNDNHFMMVQFHPGYSYSEFVETISMEKEYSDKGGIKYGKFRELVKRAEENKNDFYCLIIDEINRANVSETCGELLYGLEYRDGVPIRTSISEAELTVPSNIYIICTMNTADRSLQSLDYALRRRFVFVPVYSEKPEPKTEKPYYKIKTGKFFMNGIYDKVSEWINDSCARGLEPVDIMPGVSYFLVNEKDGSYDAAHLDYKLEYELLPLLEEYMKNGMFSKRNKIFENKSLAEMLKDDRLKLKDLISEVKQ